MSSTFKFRTFLDQHKIYYVTSGPNTSKNHISIKCPWCGKADPSEHLGISLTTQNYNCWRNTSHGGRKPQRLIQALLGCTYAQATDIAGQSVAFAAGSFSAFAKDMLDNHSTHTHTKDNLHTHPILNFPKQFKHITPIGLGKSFFNHIKRRGYSSTQTKTLIGYHDLRFAMTGPFKGRVIIPVYSPEGALVGWTGRAITKNAKTRYKTLSHNEEKAIKRDEPLALLNIKHTIFNFHNLIDYTGHILFICEGAFDAMKVDGLGIAEGMRATALYSLNMTEEQVGLLSELAENFDHINILLDAGATEQAMIISQALKHINAHIKSLPDGVEDPDELDSDLIKSIF